MPTVFCVDCKYGSGKGGFMKCEKTRTQEVDVVTGSRWSTARYCTHVRNGRASCSTFEPKPTTWERIKEVFNGSQETK
jgi:hypothetical protein